ncbi:cAMP-specific 3',5'-cyclic phosphodiesterase, isoform I [Papilio xuthus]|uniref:cAMP-specific 3',5'-cyclic phosphodiesterase, isoform I n=1 Tax=Papilio xuthus TaxID=66420 RepID=A0A194PXB0_PAPXU|nr:cAMP-specific 3',5'-cyclic phosphodiesterase, isoform I [Papilio xuthus]
MGQSHLSTPNGDENPGLETIRRMCFTCVEFTDIFYTVTSLCKHASIDYAYCKIVIPEPIVSSPRPIGQQSPLPGIEEEDDSDWPLEDATDATLTPSYRSTKSSTDTAFTSSRSSGKKRSFGSPSSVKICVSAAARKSSKARQRGAAGAGAAGQCEETQSQGAHSTLGSHSSHGRMQAEQGSIGELQKYHGRYLKSRRHTLANVR